MLTAADAHAAGLVNQIVAPSSWKILAVVRELGTTMASHAPLTIRATKEMLRRLCSQRRLADGADEDLDRALLHERGLQGRRCGIPRKANACRARTLITLLQLIPAGGCP